MSDRCSFKLKKGYNCGSYAFNLHQDGINQGELCDVHYWEAECTELRNSAGCTRSHPHEEMTIVCERLTEEARNTNKLANECAELRKNYDRYLFWRDCVEPNDIQEMIMLDPADTDKAVDRAIQTWEEDQERRKAYAQYYMERDRDR